MHMEEGSLVEDLIHNIKEITTFLVIAGKLILDKMINLMLNARPSSCENLVVNIFGQVVLPTREGLIERLLNEKQ